MGMHYERFGHRAASENLASRGGWVALTDVAWALAHARTTAEFKRGNNRAWLKPALRKGGRQVGWPIQIVDRVGDFDASHRVAGQCGQDAACAGIPFEPEQIGKAAAREDDRRAEIVAVTCGAVP